MNDGTRSSRTDPSRLTGMHPSESRDLEIHDSVGPDDSATRAMNEERRLELKLDELLCEVAAEPELDPHPELPLELAPNRLSGDVARWLATQARPPRSRRATPRPAARRSAAWTPGAWMPAAAAALMLLLGTAVSWRSLEQALTPRGDAPAAAFSARAGQVSNSGGFAPSERASEESWYVQVARAPDPSGRVALRDNAQCAGDSWYCVQAASSSRRREL